MPIFWIRPALGALALASLASGAHAAWGHSDYTHMQAYRHSEAFAAPHTEDANAAHAVFSTHDPVTIRAFEADFAEQSDPSMRKARHSDRVVDPVRG